MYVHVSWSTSLADFLGLGLDGLDDHELYTYTYLASRNSRNYVHVEQLQVTHTHNLMHCCLCRLAKFISQTGLHLSGSGRGHLPFPP